MKQIKRDLFLFVGISALVFFFALACGSPFVVRASGEVPAESQQAQSSVSPQSSVYQGTIVRNGERFLLRDQSGHIFQLDDPQHAQPFEGKNVRVTGKLDSGAKLIHVERIEAA